MLCADNVCAILDSELCKTLSPEGYRNRQLFIVGPSIVVHTSELHMLLCSQSYVDKANDMDLFVYKPLVYFLQGTSKNTTGRIRVVKKAPQRILIFHILLCSGRVNAFLFITQYISSS